jgi:hypothetical protein
MSGRVLFFVGPAAWLPSFVCRDRSTITRQPDNHTLTYGRVNELNRERQKHMMSRRAFSLTAVIALGLTICDGCGSSARIAPPYINQFSPTELTWTRLESPDTTRSLFFYVREIPAGDATLRLYDKAGNELTFGPDRIKPPTGGADLEVAIKKSEIPNGWANTSVTMELKVAGQVIPQVLPIGLRIRLQ